MTEQKTETPKTTSFYPLFNVGGMWLQFFRYGLTALFVILKLQAFGNPTEVVSWPWWLVLLPAYFVEAGVFGLCVVIGAFAVIAFVFYAMYLGIKLVVNSYKRRRLYKLTLEQRREKRSFRRL